MRSVKICGSSNGAAIATCGSAAVTSIPLTDASPSGGSWYPVGGVTSVTVYVPVGRPAAVSSPSSGFAPGEPSLSVISRSTFHGSSAAAPAVPWTRKVAQQISSPVTASRFSQEMEPSEFTKVSVSAADSPGVTVCGAAPI